MEPYYNLTYPLTQNSRWALDFADAIHYLAAHRGQPVRVTARAGITLMNGAPVSPGRYDTLRHQFSESWKQAAADGWLAECNPNTHRVGQSAADSPRQTDRSPRRIFCFVVPQLHQFEPGNLIRKPRGYVENGWLNALNTVYSRRLLNFLLYVGAATDAPQTGLAETLRQFGQACSPTLHAGRVQDAFQELVSLGLVVGQGNEWQVNWPRFRQPAPLPTQLGYSGQPVFEADWLTAEAIDPLRAHQARQIVEHGRWSPLLFWRIFTDLAATTAQQRQNMMSYTALLSPQTGPARHRLEWGLLLQQVAG